MKRSLYVFQNGTLRRKQNIFCPELTISKTEDSAPTQRRYLPIEQVQAICLLAIVNLNIKLLEFLRRNEILVHVYSVYSHHGYYMGSYYPREHYNSGYMILRQAEHYLRPKKEAQSCPPLRIRNHYWVIAERWLRWALSEFGIGARRARAMGYFQ